MPGVAGAEVAADPTGTGVGPTGVVTRTFLLASVSCLLLGLAGDARGPWARARQRVTLGSARGTSRSLALAGAFLASPATAVDLTVWAQTDLSPSASLGPVAEAFTDLYARFQRENPDITLKYEILPGGTEACRTC